MKKIIFLALFFVISSSIFAQATEKVLLNKNEEAVAKLLEAKPNGWVKKGTLTFLANQATFNNWLAGGQSNFSGNMGINYDFNYKKDNWNWDIIGSRSLPVIFFIFSMSALFLSTSEITVPSLSIPLLPALPAIWKYSFEFR